MRRRFPQRFSALRIGGLVLIAAGFLITSLAVLGPLAAGQAGVALDHVRVLDGPYFITKSANPAGQKRTNVLYF